MTGACEACLRRARLVAELSPYLDHAHAERGLLDEVLALGDEELAAALVPRGSDRARLLAAPDLAAERRRVASAGAVAVCRHDPSYPAPLRALAGPPAVLFVRGAARLGPLLADPAAAVVGARRASSYGLEMAETLGRGLAAAGVTVVSGMALGIDSAAHAGALAAGARTIAAPAACACATTLASARTIAVLGGGVDVAYPAAKRALYAELAACAALVSEMPPGFRPRRWVFPARNRIIAALAAATVVVEAAERSGALITARAARELGRDVGAVPGRVTSPLAAGTNALLRDGAHLVDGPQAVLDLLFGVGRRRAPGPLAGGELPPRLRGLLGAVREGRDTTTALADGRDHDQLLADLAELELRGHLRRAPGGAYVPRA